MKLDSQRLGSWRGAPGSSSARGSNGNVRRKNYVDSHGQSEVAFAFCALLGFDLLPRLRGISQKRLYRVEAGSPDDYPNLHAILTRAIDWELIARQYDEMVKYATALRLGPAETEDILRRFTRDNLKHPTYQALLELGKVKRTVFLCRYLQSEALRQEIHDGLNVVERWNGTNSFIFFGQGGEVATNRLDDQEVSVLSLHLVSSDAWSRALSDQSSSKVWRQS